LNVKSIDQSILLVQCLKNKEWAQKELYDLYSEELYALCCRYATDKNEAKDILQEGFIKIFTNLSQFKNEGTLIGWMKRIMINTALNYIKKHKSQLHSDVEDYKETISNSETIFQQIDAKDIMKSFIQLPYKYRIIMGLYIIEGYNYNEISQLLQLDEATCRTRVYRGKLLLQKMWQEELKTHSK
jgi:RNA polymerase sigma factor (sigma-70 family)